MPGRVFAAIDLHPGAVRLIGEASRRFTALAPAWSQEKWVAPRLLHVTLGFFGTVPDQAVEPLLEALSAAAGRVAPFDLALERLRAVPSRGRATMLWATLDDSSGECDALSRTVDEAAEATLRGASQETSDRPAPREDAESASEPTRRFRPHVTVCRARRARRAPQEAVEAASAVLMHPGKAADRCVSVRSATLYASTLGPGGPTYAVLGRIAFRGD